MFFLGLSDGPSIKPMSNLALRHRFSRTRRADSCDSRSMLAARYSWITRREYEPMGIAILDSVP
jgi:hypothetical protein